MLLCLRHRRVASRASMSGWNVGALLAFEWVAGPIQIGQALLRNSGLLLVLQKDRLSGLLPGGACPAPGINRACWGTKGKCATSSSCSSRGGIDSSLSVRDEASERLMASSDPTKSILIILILQLSVIILRDQL